MPVIILVIYLNGSVALMVEEINQLYNEGFTYKEIGRKSETNINEYKKAAEAFDKAANLSFEYAKKYELESHERWGVEILALYYLFEKHECYSAGYYNIRDIDNALKHWEESIKHLRDAISLAKHALSKSESDKFNEKYTSHLNVWRYLLDVNVIKGDSIKAREAWDNERVVEAFDLYKIIVEKTKALYQHATIYVSEGKLPLVYKRIATGNLIGMMANISSAMAKLVYQKSGNLDDSSKAIPIEMGIKLVKHILESYRLATNAFDENPEWDQYLNGAQISMNNIEAFLKDNKDKWKILFIEFENDTEVINLMKKIDSKQYRKARDELIGDNKHAKLWSVGGFWLFVLLVIFSSLFMAAKVISSWWVLVMVIVLGEGVFVILGGLVLRSIGDVSEKGFLEMIKMSFEFQFKIIKNFKWKNDSSKK